MGTDAGTDTSEKAPIGGRTSLTLLDTWLEAMDGETLCLTGKVTDCWQPVDGTQENASFYLKDLSIEADASSFVFSGDSAETTDNLSQISGSADADQMSILISSQKTTSQINEMQEIFGKNASALCYLQEDETLPKAGSYVRVFGEVSPFLQATNPGEFDAAAYYRRKDCLFALRKTKITAQTKTYGRLEEFLSQLRYESEVLFRKLLGEKNGATASAMVLGRKKGMDSEVKALYQEILMSRKTELAKNTAILTVGKLCTQCISFFLLPLYTAILSTEEYGTFDLLVTYSALLLPLVNWQLDQGLFRFMLDYRGNKEEESKLLSTLLFSSMMQSVVYFGMYLIITPKLHIENAYFLLLYVILQVFTALFLQFVRGLGESVKYTVASFISATTTTILNVIALVILKMGLQGLFVSTLSAQIVTLIYLIFASKCWEYISPKNIHLSIFKSVGTYSIPLIPNNLAWWVVNASDRTIIAHFLTTAANGIYSVANKFPNVFISFYNILNLSWTETVSLHYGDEDRDEFLTETMTSLFKLFAAACFGIVACMPFVFPIMVNLKYSAAYNQILILMYAMLFRVLVGLYSCVYVAQKNAKKIAYTSISAAIINIAVDLILINKIQVFAASLSTLIAFLSMFIVRYIDVNKTVHMKIRKPIIIGSVLIGGMLIGTYYCGNRMIQFAALCITAVYAILTNVDMLKSGVNLVKSRLGK